MEIILTVKDLSEYLKVSVTTIYRKVDNNTIPHFKINDGEKAGIRFKKTEIDSWIISQKV